MDKEEIKEIKILIKGIKAYQRMVTAYRIGMNKLPDFVFDDIEEAKLVVSKYENQDFPLPL